MNTCNTENCQNSKIVSYDQFKRGHYFCDFCYESRCKEHKHTLELTIYNPQNGLLICKNCKKIYGEYSNPF